MTASRLRVGQLFALSLAILVLFAVGGFFAGMAAINSQRDSRRMLVDHVDPALVASERFLIAMVDQETGIRGYALGGNEAFLEPYARGTREAPQQLARLSALIGRSPETDAVAATARSWRGKYALVTIAAVRNGRTTFTTADVLAGKGRFDAIRAAVSRLETRLNQRRAQTREQLRSASHRVRIIFIGVILAIAAAIVIAAVVLQRFVVNPVRRLADEVRRVARGDFAHTVEVKGAREVVELAADVDVMRTRILAERDDLQRSNAELEQFAYVASHDLQEPLRKVASFTQMLQRRYEGQLDERADQYIDFAVDGAKRMQELINDLLAFSRVGRLRDAMVEVDCNETIGHALSSMSGRLREAGAHVEVGDLPTVLGEPNLLELVFANLITNGVKFRREDVDPVVSVSAQRREDDWCFTVRDNGIGIDAEYADRIFVIFQRLHPRSVYEGTGIGLSMCRKIIEYHGGTIWLADPSDASGTTFHFTLPAIKETPA